MSDLEARIRGLAPEQQQLIRQRLGAKRRAAATRIPRVPRDGNDFPLSFSQERLWFLDQLAPGNAFYNLSFALRLEGIVTPAALDAALSDLVGRHEALRTSFPTVDGEPVQRIHAGSPVNCPVIDLDSMPMTARESEVRRVASELAMAPFDLSESPLFRAQVVRMGAFGSVFLFVIHHIVADAWSLEVLFRDLAAYYEARLAHRNRRESEPALQYVDFTVWQRRRLQGDVLDRQLDYWRGALKDLPTLNLPLDHARPAFQRFRGGQLEFAIPDPTVALLRELGKAGGCTPFMVLLAGFFVLLQRYCRQDDLVVGTPIANRNHRDLEQVIGFFANTLVMRGDLSGDPSFRALLESVRGMTLDALSHQDLPFSRLVAALRPAQDLSRNPLFQVSFQLVASAHAGQLHSPAVRAQDRAVTFERSTAIFDLTLNLWDTGSGIHGNLEYSSDLFERATVQAMVDSYLTVLDRAAQDPDSPIGRVPLLSDTMLRRLVVDWNDTGTDLPAGVCLHTLFDAQADGSPEAPALCHGPYTVTYRELARRVDCLAGEIISICPPDARRIGVLCRPGFDMVTAVLAILKSGSAYVPLDVTAPADRLNVMLEDASIELVLTDRDFADRLADSAVHGFCVDGEHRTGAAAVAHPAPYVVPGDCAYVIFTSGSTGRPKGVMVSHASVVNYLTWCKRTYPVGSGAGAPLISPLSSDLSVTSLFLPLITGEAVHFLDGDQPLDDLDQALRHGPGFSYVKLTPSHLVGLHNLAGSGAVPTGTNAFIVGGEALRGEHVAPWRDVDPGIRFHNEYGPTEATVGCCVHTLRADQARDGPVPIGKPIDNTRLYVLDQNGLPAAIGVPGELYIGGAGVAMGYIAAPDNRPGPFVADHISGDPSGTLYRTGDLVRHRPDGELEYLGRLDRQLKIRGHRVEPGDVEATLCQHEAVVDAVVLGSESADRHCQLLAFVVPTAPAVSDDLVRELRGFLSRKLPSHMIPARIVPIESIPRTTSGKTDIGALAVFDAAAAPAGRAVEPQPPQTPLEQLVALTFSEVLSVQSVSVRDDFFAHLGGDSLLATQVVSRLRELLQVELPLRVLFEASTVEDLVVALKAEPDGEKRLEGTAQVLLEVLEMSEDEVQQELGAGGEHESDTKEDG